MLLRLMAGLAGCEEVGEVNVVFGLMWLLLLLLLLVLVLLVIAVVTVVEATARSISSTGLIVSGPSRGSTSRRGRHRTVAAARAAAATAKDRTVLRTCRCHYRSCCGRHTFRNALDSARASRSPVVSACTDAVIGIASRVLPDVVAVVAWSLGNVGKDLR